MRRSIVTASLVALGAVLGAPASADDRDRAAEVPSYELPSGVDESDLPPTLREAARRAVRELRDPPTPDAAAEASRLLAGLGAPALPAVVEGLREASLRDASWYARASLVSAIAEMDAPQATPLLLAAAGDPSFAVREAAVRGLGKTGAGVGVPAVLLQRIDPAVEDVWRVRASAATALRRAVLRGVAPRPAGEEALARALLDPDGDARRAALRAVGPLAAPAALPSLLALFRDRGTAPSDRAAVLSALRAYDEAHDELLPELRRGLLETDASELAGQAGATLLQLGGARELDDPEVSRMVVHHLGDAGAPFLRWALGELGPDAAPWLVEQIRELARRIASRRAEHQQTPIESLVEILYRVRVEDAFTVLRELSVGRNAAVLSPETRRFALRKVRTAFAPRLAEELRAAFDGPAGDGVRRELLSAIEASGGDDLAERLDAALVHDDAEARWVAVDLLKRRPELPAGKNLRALARNPEIRHALRREAVEALARRDADEAGRLAAGLLDATHADVQTWAIELVGRSEDPQHFDALLERLNAEASDEPELSTPPPDGAAVTPTSTSSADRRRRTQKKALLTALRSVGGARARPTLIDTLRTDEDPTLRETAARLLRGIVDAADEGLLDELLRSEGEPKVRDTLLDVLVTLEGSDVARGVFSDMLADRRERMRALQRLRASTARVLPAGLEDALTDEAWNDEDRSLALLVLERHGRIPPPATLERLVRGARDKMLAEEALRLLADNESEEAAALLRGLVEGLDDPDKLAMAVGQLSGAGRPALVPVLIEILERWREPAFGAALASEPALQIYRNAAVGLGRCGAPEGGAVLLRHLLDARTSRALAPLSVTGNGPFQPATSPPVRAVRGLICGLAHLDDATCGRLLDAELESLRHDGRDLRLDEGYVDGIARYLRDPVAYRLPGRKRPGTALRLLQLVGRLAPRLSPLDVEAQGYVVGQLETEKRFDEALAAHTTLLDLRDVEEASRSRSRRLEERAKSDVLRARAASAAGRQDEALALLAEIRATDPGHGGLAYLHGYGLVKIGAGDATARASLEYAVTADERNPRPHLYLGWMVEQSEGAARALVHYERAAELDLRRRQEAGGAFNQHRRGMTHQKAFYFYYRARAMALAGDLEGAGERLLQSIVYDDRNAATARREPAFQAASDLEALLAEGLDAIPSSD